MANGDPNEKAPASGGPGQGREPLESSTGTAEATSPDMDAALSALATLLGDRPRVLTAIASEGEGIDTDTFTADDLDGQRRFIAEHNNSAMRWNIYWHVNPVLRHLKRKAKRKDVAALDYLHVDIDPRAGEELAEDQRRALDLHRNSPGDVPKPTAIIFSGGGYQGFWRLEKPLPIDGEESAYEEAKRYNQKLELIFGADNCHNVDRIMRVPGTVNWPKPEKREKGRVPALAALVEYHANRVYSIDQFAKAPAESPKRQIEHGAHVGANVERIASMDDPRLYGVSNRAKAVVVHGHDPEEPHHWPSRSEAVYFVACEMVRAGCDDETIFAILTDPDFGISTSILDKGRGSHRYALRQIERARADVENDAIAQINLDYFAVLEGAKVTFYREEDDGTVTPMNKEAFLFELGHLRQTVREGNSTKELEAVRLWLKHPRHRYYPRGFVLDPSDSHGFDQYNLWRGFGILAAPGDWSQMYRHIVEVLAAGNVQYADYIIRWTAWKLQNPATPPRVAIVFRGEEDVGKGVFCNALVVVFGAHGLRVQSMSHVAGKFNAHLRHCCLLFADEAILPHDENEGALKGMITDPTLPIEAKGRDVVHAENHLALVLSSNNEWVIPAGIGARRFAMFDVADTYKGDAAYFAALFAESENGGLAAMLHDLLAMDLGGWHPDANRPDTAALNDQKMRSLPPLERFWLDCLMTGTLPCGRCHQDGTAFLPTVYFIGCVEGRMRRTDITANAVQALFQATFGFRKKDNARPRGWEIPSLAEARQRWDAVRFPVSWDASETWDISAPTGEPKDETRQPDSLPF